MEKRTSLLFGITLIVLAVLALAGNLLLRLGGNVVSVSGQAWPLIVIGAMSAIGWVSNAPLAGPGYPGPGGAW